MLAAPQECRTKGKEVNIMLAEAQQDVLELKPILTVKNVWCPKCGQQKFEHRHTLLVCTHCGCFVEWNKTWQEWFGISSPCLLGFNLNEAPSGTKWEPQFGGYQYTMIDQYNPNTGVKLADPKVREALLRAKSCLEKKLARTEHQLESTKERR